MWCRKAARRKTASEGRGISGEWGSWITKPVSCIPQISATMLPFHPRTSHSLRITLVIMFNCRTFIVMTRRSQPSITPLMHGATYLEAFGQHCLHWSTSGIFLERALLSSYRISQNRLRRRALVYIHLHPHHLTLLRSSPRLLQSALPRPVLPQSALPQSALF